MALVTCLGLQDFSTRKTFLVGTFFVAPWPGYRRALIAFQDYLRDQMTITEVAIARLYNWDVKRRKEKKGEAAASVETKA